MNEKLSMNQVFLKRLSEIVEQNLENDQFGVEELAREVGMSRSQLHRKLRSLTKKSASQFIREFRLHRAMELLQQDAATASEIAFRVGFGSPSYFNKCFHDYFGYPPGEVKRKRIANIAISKTGYGKGKRSFLRKAMMVLVGLLITVAMIRLFYTRFGGEVTNESGKSVLPDKSIVVLPFRNLSGDTTNQYFVEGMTGEIRTRLSKIQTLKVISSISSESYRKSSKTLPQIAQELGAVYVLEGSVQKYGDQARLYVQLIEGSTDHHIWSENYKLEMTDIFSIQSNISTRVATELKAVLSPYDIQQMEKKPTRDLEAYTLYLKGRFFWNRRTLESVRRSIGFFEQSIAKDPNYALAYAGLADAYLVSVIMGWVPPQAGYAKAKDFALKAIEIDENLAEAHASLGAIKFRYEWKWKEAEREFRRAISGNPNCVTAHLYYSAYLNLMGKYEEGAYHLDKALELDPLSMEVHTLRGWRFYRKGQYEEAINECQYMHEVNSNYIPAYHLAFYAYWAQGNPDEAIHEIQQVLSLNPESAPIGKLVGDIYEKSGMNGVLQGLLDYWLVQPNPPPTYVARTFAFLGEKESALEWLEKAYEMRDHDLLMISNDFFLDSLRSEPRFREILKKMGLKE